MRVTAPLISALSPAVLLNQVNFWLPLTQVYGTNTLWTESTPGEVYLSAAYPSIFSNTSWLGRGISTRWLPRMARCSDHSRHVAVLANRDPLPQWITSFAEGGGLLG